MVLIEVDHPWWSSLELSLEVVAGAELIVGVGRAKVVVEVSCRSCLCECSRQSWSVELSSEVVTGA